MKHENVGRQTWISVDSGMKLWGFGGLGLIGGCGDRVHDILSDATSPNQVCPMQVRQP